MKNEDTFSVDTFTCQLDVQGVGGRGGSGLVRGIFKQTDTVS